MSFPSLSDAQVNPAVAGLREARERERTEKRFVPYRFRPAAYISEVLGWKPWEGTDDAPGQMQVIAAYELALRQMHERRDWERGNKRADELQFWQPGQIIQNYLRIEAGHTVGKTKLMSGLFSHFHDCFVPSIIYTFAPTAQQIKDLLWKEIGTDRDAAKLPGRILETCELKTDRKDWFAKGRATDDAHGTGTEKAQGQHGEYLMFDLDEGEGIPAYVYDAVDSMASGGIVIVLMAANPKTRTSHFHKIRVRSHVSNFRISCLSHPNVREQREAVPNAVRWDWVRGMIEAHCEPVDAASPDDHTFTVGFSVEKNGVTHPPGTHWLPNPECCFRVLGIAPANTTGNTFVPTGRYEAAKNRTPVEQEAHKARIGIDVARFGDDAGTLYVRWNGRAWRAAQLSKLDSVEYKETVKKIARELKARGVTSLHVRVDGGGGFGGGLVDGLKRDQEMKDLFAEYQVLEVHFNGVPHDPKAYKNLGTEMYSHAAETLKSLALLNPPDALETDLCERAFEWVNVKGVDVKSLTSKEVFKRDKKHSPDDGDGFVLAAAPDFILIQVPAGKAAGLNPSAMFVGLKR